MGNSSWDSWAGSGIMVCKSDVRFVMEGLWAGFSGWGGLIGLDLEVLVEEGLGVEVFVGIVVAKGVCKGRVV